MRINDLRTASALAVCSFTAAVSARSSYDREDPLTSLYKRILVDFTLASSSCLLNFQMGLPKICAKYFAIAMTINLFACALFQATGSSALVENALWGLIGVTYALMLGTLSILHVKER